MSSIVLELIHHVLRNLVRTYNINKTYVDKDYQSLVILTLLAFKIRSSENRLKHYSPGQLKFGLDIILPVKCTVD